MKAVLLIFYILWLVNGISRIPSVDQRYEHPKTNDEKGNHKAKEEIAPKDKKFNSPYEDHFLPSGITCKSFYDYVCLGEPFSVSKDGSSIKHEREYVTYESEKKRKTYFDILQEKSASKMKSVMKELWEYESCLIYRREMYEDGGRVVEYEPYDFSGKEERRIYDLATAVGTHLKKGGSFFLGLEVNKKVDEDVYCLHVYDNYEDEVLNLAMKTHLEKNGKKNAFLSKMIQFNSSDFVKRYDGTGGIWNVGDYVRDYETLEDSSKRYNSTKWFLNRVSQVMYDGRVNLSCVHYNGAWEYYDYVVKRAIEFPDDFYQTLKWLFGNATHASKEDCAKEVLYRAKREVNDVFLQRSSYVGKVSENVKTVVEDLRNAMKDIIVESEVITNEAFKIFCVKKLEAVKIYVLTDSPTKTGTKRREKFDENRKDMRWENLVRRKVSERLEKIKLTVNSGLKPSEFAELNEESTYEEVYDSTGVGVVNAWYDPLLNAITVPAGIVGWPVYQGNSYGTADMYDLSRLGMILAHELGHALDNNGRCYDWRGNYDETFCNGKGRDSDVKDAMKCLTEDYGHPCGKRDEYGSKTLGEDIADQLGVRAAFRVFNEKYADYVRLEDQRDFWRKYASLWCDGAHPSLSTASRGEKYRFFGSSSVTEEELEKDRKNQCAVVRRDVHALPKHRVDKTLRQLKEFSSVFGCEPTDDMVNPRPCLIY